MRRYDTSPYSDTNPPSVAQTILKFVIARVGILAMTRFTSAAFGELQQYSKYGSGKQHRPKCLSDDRSCPIDPRRAAGLIQIAKTLRRVPKIFLGGFLEKVGFDAVKEIGLISKSWERTIRASERNKGVR